MKPAYKWLLALSAVAAAALVWTQRELLNDVAEPRHRVVTQDGGFEIRQYEPVVAVEMLVRGGDRREASYEAFYPLFNYISGQNTTRAEIPMTAPVTTAGSGEGERIAMTAPVTQVQERDGWRVRFFLPDSYTLETAPAPTNPAIALVDVPARRVVAVRFSGRASEDSLEEQLARLKTYVQENGLTTAGDPVFAQYNSPFVLPFLRRNEFLWRLEPDEDGASS